MTRMTGMTRPIAGLALALILALAAEVAAPSLLAVSQAQAQQGGTLVLAQNNQGPGGFFRRLFGNRQPQRQPERRYESPLELLPGFDMRPREQPRRERRERRSEPAPAEVAAVEKAPGAKRALVIGDFFAAALAKGLAEAYRENPNVVVIDATSGSSGLVRADYYDWPAQIPELVAEQKPDAILLVIGGNDRQAIRTEAGSQALGSDGWRAAYTARVAAFADALKASGKPALWVSLVPVSAALMSRDYSTFNGIVREQLEAKGLQFVDAWNGFADEDGKYVSSGPDISGQPAQLRAGDGLSFTKAGQRKLAYFVEQTLTDIFGGAAPVLASVTSESAALPAEPGAMAPAIGPMVPLEALSLAGGDALSGSGGTPGDVATAIASELASSTPRPVPAARVDSYPWLPDAGFTSEPTTGVGTRR